MYPFINILGLQIPLYGLMMALAFAVALWYCVARKKALGLTSDQIVDIVFYLLIGAIIGGKLCYIIFYWQDFQAASALDKLRYGFVFLGGFIGAAISSVIIFRKQKIPFFKGADFFTPAIPLGHAIGKIGCFLAGCCYGKISHLPWLSVAYNNQNSLVPEHLHGVGLYPIQLIESFTDIILFLILHKLYKAKHKDGTVFAAYIIGFCVVRFVVEFFRGEDEVYILGITQTQITSLILIILATTFLMVRKYAKR
ncbi:MAG: prolipoprotein diacylglyceryl transferase [Elusimicrobiota bacterium]|jgi:phosphatidylglycerol:prolipoprotein diacylglycerol transferase|nr:prolipoprotein diacylglyceryl transferase [Elusimicrobiota bacterium]